MHKNQALKPNQILLIQLAYQLSKKKYNKKTHVFFLPDINFCFALKAVNPLLNEKKKKRFETRANFARKKKKL
jgi:hypothetical protein